jgi:hypothetical protein
MQEVGSRESLAEVWRRNSVKRTGDLALELEELSGDDLLKIGQSEHLAFVMGEIGDCLR